jgi:hypothetical protein
MNSVGFGNKQSWPNLKVLSWNLAGGSEENYKKTSVRMAELCAKIIS